MLNKWVGLRSCWRWHLACLLLTTVSAVSGQSDATRAMYEVTTRTGMPNLDDALRYAVITKNQCLTRDQLVRAFWMLNEVSLQDCQLRDRDQSKSQHNLTLQCAGGYGTSGNATWQFDANRASGTLNVRLGGKNMTFYQRIVARRTGLCP